MGKFVKVFHLSTFSTTNAPRTVLSEGWLAWPMASGSNGWNRLSKMRSKIVVVHSLNLVWLFLIPWTTACQAPLSSTVSWSLLKFMSIESVMLSNHLILWCLLLVLPSIFPSIRVFSKELTLRIMWPKYWSFSFSISPFNEYSGLLSFRIEWFDLLAVQGTLKSILPYHNSNASILRCQEAKGPKYIYLIMDIVSLRTWSIFWLQLCK